MNNDITLTISPSISAGVRDIIGRAIAIIQAGEPMPSKHSYNAIGEHCVNKKRAKRNAAKKAQKASRRANRS